MAPVAQRFKPGDRVIVKISGYAFLRTYMEEAGIIPAGSVCRIVKRDDDEMQGKTNAIRYLVAGCIDGETTQSHYMQYDLLPALKGSRVTNTAGSVVRECRVFFMGRKFPQAVVDALYECEEPQFPRERAIETAGGRRVRL